MAEQRGLVLVVDDERDLRTLLEFNLRQAGYQVAQAGTGAEALARARSLRPLVIVLDLNLPDVAGTDVCRLLKADEATRAIPILMLTARGSEGDRILGLELGADDYVTKPFSVREVVLRVDAVARRADGARGAARPAGERILKVGPIELDLDGYIVRVDGEELPLTLQEFKLLAYLVEGKGRVRTRDELLTNVWNASPDLETRTVDTHVKRLRDKLGVAGHASPAASSATSSAASSAASSGVLPSLGDVIETVRGLGYRIRPQS